MELASTVHGHGPTLVLVHGLAHRQHAWDPVLPELTGHRRVVTVDLPGHGDSPALAPSSDPVTAIVDAVDGMLDALTPDGARPHVAGNSLGGLVALQLAVRGRAQRAQLPYIAHNPVLRSATLFPFFGRPWQVNAESALVDALGLIDNAVIDPVLDQGFGDAPAVQRTTVPVTIAWGRRDLVLPVHQARAARRQFPDATHVVLPGLGHVPMSDDPGRIGLVLLGGSA